MVLGIYHTSPRAYFKHEDNKNIFFKLKKEMKKVEKFIKKNKLALVAVALLLFLFYWFQIRPTIIRKKCFIEAVSVEKEPQTADYIKESVNFHYKTCIVKNGMRSESIYE